MKPLEGKTLVITGATRGIGKAIGLRAAQDGANIVVIGKTDTPHPKLPGTVHTAVKEMEDAGGHAVAAICDIRFEDQVQHAIDLAQEKFGGIDILVNNASAISLTPTLATEMKRFDLMYQVNTRGTFLTSKLAIPLLKQAENPHILTLSPPLNMEPKWFANHVAYTITKYGMSMVVLGLAEELARDGIAVNALWPRTTIDTAAVRNLLGGKHTVQHSRTPEIIADAAYLIFQKPSTSYTGQFLIDDEVLMQHGICNLEKYAVNPNKELMQDFFLTGEGQNFCEDPEDSEDFEDSEDS